MRSDSTGRALILCTRLAVRIPSAALPTHEWVGRRLDLLCHYTIPSVRRLSPQPTAWLLFVDATLEASVVDTLLPRLPDFGQLVATVGPFSPSMVAEAVHSLSLQTEDVATIRLDSDDIVAPHFLVPFDEVSVEQPTVLNLPMGMQLLDGAPLITLDRSNAFVGLIEPLVEGIPLDTVHAHPHDEMLHHYPVRNVLAPPSWCQVLHGGNLANTATGIPLPPKLAPVFLADWTTPSTSATYLHLLLRQVARIAIYVIRAPRRLYRVGALLGSLRHVRLPGPHKRTSR